MRYLITLVFLFSFSLHSFTQGVFSENQDTILKTKMSEYMSMIKKANVYQGIVETQVSVVSLYKKEARRYLDSAYIVAKKGEIDKAHAELYIMQFNFLYDVCSQYTKKADSTLLVAIAYKDTATMLNREAETFYLKLAEDYKPVLQQDTLHPIFYVVQLGAGNMEHNYFDKVLDVEVITPSDGIKRFVTGKFKSKDDALAYRQKMIDFGYTDAFIRTLESLNY
jgi:predicted aspartyl protease